MSITPTSAKIRVCYIPLVEQRNMSLDDFNSHYASLISSDSGFLDMKGVPNIELDMNIRIADIDSEAFRSTMKYNYAVIQTTANTPADVKNYYFYIRDIQREANNVLRLSLHMDVLNTYKQWKDYLSDRTLIMRQHEDRFAKPFTKYVPLVDRISENINPHKYRKSRTSLKEPGTPYKKWYLIYRTPDDDYTSSDFDSNNPIRVECICEDSLKISNDSSSGIGSDVVVSAAQLSLGGGYYILEDDSPGFSYTPEGGTTATNAGAFPRLFMTLFYTNDGTTINVVQYEGTKGSQGWRISNIIPLEPLNPYTYITFHKATFLYRLGGQTTDVPTIKESDDHYQINAGTTTVDAVYSQAFSNLDRSDPKIVKIIELPYPPCEVVVSGGLYSLEPYFEFDQSTQRFKKKLLDESTRVSLDPVSNSFYPINQTPVSLGVARTLKDPKLWHSDFTSIVYRFDNFAYELKCECVDAQVSSWLTEVEPFKFRVDFYPSIDVSTSFLFMLMGDNGYSQIHDEQFFPGSFVSGRNNEKTIFNNAYINYMRTGFNYDTKSKNLSNMMSIVSAGGAMIGAAAGGAFAGPVGAVVGAGIAMATSFTQTLGAIEQRDISFQKNLTQLQNQAVQVAGSGDLSLFNAYGGLLDVGLFQPADTEMEKLDDLFYYFGYARNIFGKPNIASRSYFNFLQCEPDFYDAYGLYLPGVDIPKWALDEIVSKCKEGITFFHWVNSAYDLAQKKENLEVSLV